MLQKLKMGDFFYYKDRFPSYDTFHKSFASKNVTLCPFSRSVMPFLLACAAVTNPKNVIEYLIYLADKILMGIAIKAILPV